LEVIQDGEKTGEFGKDFILARGLSGFSESVIQRSGDLKKRTVGWRRIDVWDNGMFILFQPEHDIYGWCERNPLWVTAQENKKTD
jgi:hypothetical protein